jgi:hypothetical protein
VKKENWVQVTKCMRAGIWTGNGDTPPFKLVKDAVKKHIEQNWKKCKRVTKKEVTKNEVYTTYSLWGCD